MVSKDEKHWETIMTVNIMMMEMVKMMMTMRWWSWLSWWSWWSWWRPWWRWREGGAWEEGGGGGGVENGGKRQTRKRRRKRRKRRKKRKKRKRKREKKRWRGWLSLIDWLTDCLVDWLIDCLVDWLIGWLIDWLIDCLVDWLIGWLIDWLIDWLMMLMLMQLQVLVLVLMLVLLVLVLALGNKWKAIGKLLGDHIWETTGLCGGQAEFKLGNIRETTSGTNWETIARPPARQTRDNWVTSGRQDLKHNWVTGRHLETIGYHPRAFRDWNYLLLGIMGSRAPTSYQPIVGLLEEGHLPNRIGSNLVSLPSCISCTPTTHISNETGMAGSAACVTGWKWKTNRKPIKNWFLPLEQK